MYRLNYFSCTQHSIRAVWVWIILTWNKTMGRNVDAIRQEIPLTEQTHFLVTKLQCTMSYFAMMLKQTTHWVCSLLISYFACWTGTLSGMAWVLKVKISFKHHFSDVVDIYITVSLKYVLQILKEITNFWKWTSERNPLLIPVCIFNDSTMLIECCYSASILFSFAFGFLACIEYGIFF